MTIPLGIGFGLLAILAFAYYRKMAKADASRRARFVSREAMSSEEFLAECGISDREAGAQVLDLRHSMSLEFDIPEGKIRPGDRFDVELRPEKGWEFDDGVALLMQDLQAARHAKKLSTDTSKIVSVKDYVKARIEQQPKVTD